MPSNWGQRYFEEQPPDKDPSEGPPEKRQARFYEVFGNSSVRTFKQYSRHDRRNARGRGSGRGRGDGRGRGNGRGRGRGHGNGQTSRGNTFSSRRNPNRSEDTSDAEDTEDEYEDNRRSRDIFTSTVGNKRPAFEQRDSEGKRRKRFVLGGRIPKFQRTEEYSGGTYCDVCNEGFRDVNAKALHDRSKRHRLNYGYLRHENKEKPDEEVDTIANECVLSEEDRRRQLEDGVAAFLSLTSKALPKPFEEWISRSLAAAKLAAVEAKDPSLLQAVQREIVDVYRVNDANCTLRRVCWTRRELATGSAYRLFQPKQAPLPVIPDSKVHVKVVPLSKKEEEPKIDKPHSAPRPRAPARDIVVEIADDSQTTPRADIRSPSNSTRPTSSAPVLQPDPLPYHVVGINWRISRDAEELQLCCDLRDKEAVLAKYYDVFGKAKEETRDCDHEQEELEATESLVTTYRGLRRQYDSEDYEYDDLMHSLSTVANGFEKEGKRSELLCNLYQMQIQIALQAGEFRDCLEPCSKYVQTYSQRRSVQGRRVHFVGHWFVSLLFKSKSKGSRKGFPEMLEIAQEMRRLPERATEDMWVDAAIQAVKAVLGNNWCSFFGRSISSIVHCRGPTFKQTLEGLVPFMRERAILVMMHMNIRRMRETKMVAPPDIRLEDIRRLLGWDSSDDEGGSMAEAKDFVASLPQPFENVCEEDNSDWIRWRGKGDDDLMLSGDSDVREEMLIKWGKPIVLQED